MCNGDIEKRQGKGRKERKERGEQRAGEQRVIEKELSSAVEEEMMHT